jgi:hypothetical protein
MKKIYSRNSQLINSLLTFPTFLCEKPLCSGQGAVAAKREHKDSWRIFIKYNVIVDISERYDGDS